MLHPITILETKYRNNIIYNTICTLLVRSMPEIIIFFLFSYYYNNYERPHDLSHTCVPGADDPMSSTSHSVWCTYIIRNRYPYAMLSLLLLLLYTIFFPSVLLYPGNLFCPIVHTISETICRRRFHRHVFRNYATCEITAIIYYYYTLLSLCKTLCALVVSKTIFITPPIPAGSRFLYVSHHIEP